MRNALLIALTAGCATASSSPAQVTGGAPVVIELFTSQGCSSCPPADQLVADLARAGQSHGRAVVPLAFHVDYWNDLGWNDPFSSPAWTARQQDYARALNDRSVYTPELVVAGGAGMVGSQPGRIADAIAHAPMQRDLQASATWSATALSIEATPIADAQLFVAVWEDAPKTSVPSGENAGSSLVSDRVVRVLQRVDGPTHVALDPSWKPAGAVVFAQQADRHIVGAKVIAQPAQAR
jgi:hypothetical protein